MSSPECMAQGRAQARVPLGRTLRQQVSQCHAHTAAVDPGWPRDQPGSNPKQSPAGAGAGGPGSLGPESTAGNAGPGGPGLVVGSPSMGACSEEGTREGQRDRGWTCSPAPPPAIPRDPRPCPPADAAPPQTHRPSCLFNAGFMSFPWRATSTPMASSSGRTGVPAALQGSPLGQGWARCYFFFGIFSFLTSSENSRAGDKFLVNKPPALCPQGPAGPMGRCAPFMSRDPTGLGALLSPDRGAGGYQNVLPKHPHLLGAPQPPTWSSEWTGSQQGPSRFPSEPPSTVSGETEAQRVLSKPLGLLRLGFPDVEAWGEMGPQLEGACGDPPV